MAKNRNKKKNADKTPMDTAEVIVSDTPQAMDTSESVAGVSDSVASVKYVIQSTCSSEEARKLVREQ
ncbi:hypothetical protein RDABS01_032411 [Bienertia sinuspersici]